MKYWVGKAFQNKGALHRSLHIKTGERIPLAKLTHAAKMKGKVGQEARLAITARHFKH